LFAGLLLATNFGEYRGRMHGRLAMQVMDTFDLRLIGDGATAKRMPLVNMLAAGFMNFRGSCEIAECTRHIKAGRKKDAKFIADLFLPHAMQEVGST
jgi:hypothetical protein